MLSGPDQARRHRYRIEPGATQAIDGRAGHALRQTGDEQRHPRHVSIVFTRLVRAAQDYFIERLPIDAGIATHEFAQRNRREVIGSYCGEDAAVTADGRTHRVTYEGVIHD